VADGGSCIIYTVLPRSIAPRFIANLAYRQNSRLSRFPPLKIPRYTAKLSYRHPPQVFRHKSRKTTSALVIYSNFIKAVKRQRNLGLQLQVPVLLTSLSLSLR
jgi:hypothetical protein